MIELTYKSSPSGLRESTTAIPLVTGAGGRFIGGGTPGADARITTPEWDGQMINMVHLHLCLILYKWLFLRA